MTGTNGRPPPAPVSAADVAALTAATRDLIITVDSYAEVALRLAEAVERLRDAVLAAGLPQTGRQGDRETRSEE